MWHRRWTVAVAILIAVASALAAAQRAPSPHYEFEIQQTPDGIALKCHHGCNWMTLTGRCEEGQKTCSFIVNERGIRVLPGSGATTPGP